MFAMSLLFVGDCMSRFEVPLAVAHQSVKLRQGYGLVWRVSIPRYNSHCKLLPLVASNWF